MRRTKVKKEPVACDLCGTVVEDPWDAHYVEGDTRHWCLCDSCNEAAIEYLQSFGESTEAFEHNTLHACLQAIQEACDAEWRREFRAIC